MPKKFTILFVVLLLIERITEHIPALNKVYYLAKPAIVLSLLCYFLKHSYHLDKQTKTLTIIALLCCVIGDILLMFQKQSPNFFIAGLGSFLIGHLFYSVVFNKTRNKTVNPLGFIVFLSVYAIGLFYTLQSNLGSMRIPVLVYIIVIALMATLAYLRKNKVPKQSYYWVVLGAIIFMISDSIIAIHQFYIPFTNAKDYIMITYALAQYLIVFGILQQHRLNL